MILQHGLLMTCVDWLIASPGGGYIRDKVTGKNVTGNNLGFVLAANGYDVWLSNVRGNSYSLEHKLFPSTGKFCYWIPP